MCDLVQFEHNQSVEFCGQQTGRIGAGAAWRPVMFYGGQGVRAAGAETW